MRYGFLLFAIMVFLAACSGDDSSNNDAGPDPDAGLADASADARGDVGAAADAAPDGGGGPKLPGGLDAGWNVIYPGGETICSRGDKYMFAVHPGTVNRLVVDFEGGGACWTTPSCAVATALFKERAEDSLKYVKEGYAEGIYNRKHPDNPFRDWYHVFIPYCTGDIHWGDAVHTYGKGDATFTINHKGAVNVQAVLAWIADNFGGPEKIFVTGCSAGSYGSLMWASHLIHQYPAAQVYQFGDSGAGVVTDSFLADSFPNWNATAAAPSWIPTLDPSKVDLLSKEISYLYSASAKHHTGHVFSQFNTLHDKTQVSYYQAMGGGTAEQWSAGMVASIDAIIDEAPTFRAFLSEGNEHCVFPYDRFYTAEVDGQRLVDWLADMVDDKPVQTQRCAACVTP